MTTKFFNGVEVLGTAIMPNPTADGHAATKYYTDSSVGSAVAALGAIDASIRTAMFGEGATTYSYVAPQSLAGTVSIANALDVLAGRVVNSTADALADANSYTDQKISDLIGMEMPSLDTLKEIVDFLGADENTLLTDSIIERIATVSTNLTTEINRAQTAESGLDARLDVLEGADTEVGSVAYAVKEEADRAKLAEAGLLSAINTEAAARELADGDLQDAIDAEALARFNADSAEAQARAQADAAIEQDLEAEILRATGAEQTLATNLQNEVDRATAEELALGQAIEAEAAFRLDGDTLLDGRLDKIETNLRTEIAYVYENNTGVFADAVAGVQDLALRDGWYFKNQSTGQKVNWYFFDGQAENVTLGDFSAYYVATFDSLVSLPFLAVYTTPTGTGDAAAWYKSKRVWVPTGTPVAGKKYLVYFGTEPEVHPELPRLQMVVSTTSTQGTLDSAERVLTVSLGSNSASAANNVQFVAESVGVFSPSVKRKVELRIRPSSAKALSDEITARTNADTTLQNNINNEAAARAAADTTLQNNINSEASTRLAADNALQDAIDAEESARIAGDAATLASANTYTNTAIANLVDAAPALLDTLNELAAAIGDDPNFAASIANQVGTVQGNLDAEIARATAAEEDLQDAIAAEQARAENAEQIVYNALQQEIQDRIADVNAEEARALAAEGLLDGRLDLLEGDETVVGSVANLIKVETDRAVEAENALIQDLADEAVARAQGDLDEMNRALAAEGLLDGRLDVLEGDATVAGSVDQKVKVETDRAVAAELAITERIDDLVAGAGMTRTGDTFDVVGTSGRLAVAADSIDIDTTLIPNLVAGDAGKRVRVNAAGNGFEYKAAADVLVTDSVQGELAAAEYVRLKAIMPVVFSGLIADNQAAAEVDATMSFPAASADAAMFDVLLKRNGKVMIGRIRITVGDGGSSIDISTEGLDPGPVGITFTAALVGSDVVLKAASTSTGFPAAVKMHRVLMKI